MTNLPTSYEYPPSGAYNETVAILEDGRRLWIDTQYATVDVEHATDCAKMVAQRSKSNVCEAYSASRSTGCTCGALDGIDESAILIDARAHGLFGVPPRKPVANEPHPDGSPKKGFGWCPKCESYCYGDCEANA